MRHTRTAITQVSRWCKRAFIKCAIVRAAIFVDAIKISPTASDVEMISLDKAVLDKVNLDFNLLATKINQDYESYIIPHNLVFYFNSVFSKKAKTLITDKLIQNVINLAFYIIFNFNPLPRRDNFSGHNLN